MFAMMKIVQVGSLNDAFYLVNMEITEFEPFTSSRLQHLQKKYKVNLEVHIKCASQGSEKFYVPLKKRFDKTICLLLDKRPRTSKSLIENFGVVNDRKKLHHEFICDVTKGCKFTTEHRFNYEKHRRTCKNFNTKKSTYVEKPFGLRSEILQEMVDKNLIPWHAVNYRNDFIATFDCETLEAKIEGPEKSKGMTEKALLNLLSIAVGTNCPEIPPKCWIRKSSAPEEEENLGRAKII